MYISKDERATLIKTKNESLDAINSKLTLILEMLNTRNNTLQEDVEDEITVEVDGETVVDTQETSVEETPVVTEENPAEEIGPTHGITMMLMDAIKDEYNTIQFYNNLIATANEEGGFEDVIRIIKHINEEEQIHVGMLQQVLKEYDTSATEVDQGRAEASDIISDEQLTATDTAIEA